MSIIIRRAEEKDIPVLEELFLQFSDWPLEREQTLRNIVKDPTSELLVAESEQEIVGLLHQIFFLDPFHAGLNSHITSLFTKDAHRKKRIGTQLLKKAIESAKQRDVVEVHVDTEEENANAIAFYQKHGFTKAGVMFETNP